MGPREGRRDKKRWVVGDGMKRRGGLGSFGQGRVLHWHGIL